MPDQVGALPTPDGSLIWQVGNRGQSGTEVVLRFAPTSCGQAAGAAGGARGGAGAGWRQRRAPSRGAIVSGAIVSGAIVSGAVVSAACCACRLLRLPPAALFASCGLTSCGLTSQVRRNLRALLDSIAADEYSHRLVCHPLRVAAGGGGDDSGGGVDGGGGGGGGGGDFAARPPGGIPCRISDLPTASGRVLLAIGPEGGWEEPAELELFGRYGFQQARLGTSCCLPFANDRGSMTSHPPTPPPRTLHTT